MSASPEVSESFVTRGDGAPEFVDMSALEGRPVRWLVLQGALRLAYYMADGSEIVIDGIRFKRVGKTLLAQPETTTTKGTQS